MYFKDIIGQDGTVAMLRQAVAEGRIPHAQLICGPEGTGGLAVALAYARYLCCTHRNGEDACGECPSCKKFDKYAHPDIHFTYPIYKKILASRKSQYAAQILALSERAMKN